MSPYPGGQKRLVCISESGVHQQQALVLPDALGETFRAFLREHLVRLNFSVMGFTGLWKFWHIALALLELVVFSIS